MVDITEFIGKKVIVTTIKDSQYQGVLFRYGLGKIVLYKMIGLHKSGKDKFCSGKPDSRIFNLSSIKEIRLWLKKNN